MRRQREIPLYTLAGVPDAEVTTHWFHTEDGLGLSFLRFQRERGGEAVMLVHGLTTSTDMFIMPEHENIVTHLLDLGYDVWCLDYRMSNRHSYNLFKHRWTLDDVALYDFPPALATMRATPLTLVKLKKNLAGSPRKPLTPACVKRCNGI